MNENCIVKSLQNISRLKADMSKLQKLKEGAFEVFDGWTSLEKFNEIFNTYWKKLYYWNEDCECKGCTYLKFNMRISDMQTLFWKVTQAAISRDSFSKSLHEACNVEECLQEYDEAIARERAKVSQLYDEFAEKTETFQFIFMAPDIKQIVMGELLHAVDIEGDD